MAGIGYDVDDEKNMLMPLDSLRAELPIEPRKRYIYLFEAENGPVLNVPLTIDHTGVFFKRHGVGNQYICGLNQKEVRFKVHKNLLNIIFFFSFEIRNLSQ